MGNKSATNTNSTSHAVRSGIFAVMVAAFFFGMSAPVVKLFLGSVSPFYLTGLLYTGGGLFVSLFTVLRSVFSGSMQKSMQNGTFQISDSEHPLTVKDTKWILACIATGILGPVLLTLGLIKSPASSASLFLSSETIFTALIASLFFKEQVNRRVWLAIGAMVAGGVVLSYQPSGQFTFPLSLLLVVAACFMWAIDSNVTRMLADRDPYPVAQMKGYAAGFVALGAGVVFGEPFPAPGITLGLVLVGGLCYGISLVSFIYGLRHLGTARNGAYFGTAPFIGAVGSLFLLREPLTWNLVFAFFCIAAGMVLLFREERSRTDVVAIGVPCSGKHLSHEG